MSANGIQGEIFYTPRIGEAAELGGNKEIILFFQKTPDELFTPPQSIDIGGVDKVDPLLHCRDKSAQGCGVIYVSPVCPQLPGSQTDF